MKTRGMFVELVTAAGEFITVGVEGPYNPDTLDDITNRATKLLVTIEALAATDEGGGEAEGTA